MTPAPTRHAAPKRRRYLVGWSEHGVLFEPLTGLYATHERALARLDRILGEMRRKRIREPDGWYFIYGPDGVQDVVGTGKEKGKEMPKFSASVR